MAKGWLPDLIGALIKLAGVEQVSRQVLNLIAGAGVTITVEDNPGSEQLDITFSADAGATGGGGGGPVNAADVSTSPTFPFGGADVMSSLVAAELAIGDGGYPPTIPANAILGNGDVTEGPAGPANPQLFRFGSAYGGAYDLSLRVAPEENQGIGGLANGASRNIDTYSISGDGIYSLLVEVTAKLASGEYRSKGVRCRAIRIDGAIELEDASVDFSLGGNSTGLVLAITHFGDGLNAGQLRVIIQNDTGEVIDAVVHIGWTKLGLL